MVSLTKEEKKMTYIFLQHYWWFIVSLLGALLVFLMFVQGANSMVFSLELLTVNFYDCVH